VGARVDDFSRSWSENLAVVSAWSPLYVQAHWRRPARERGAHKAPDCLGLFHPTVFTYAPEAVLPERRWRAGISPAGSIAAAIWAGWSPSYAQHQNAYHRRLSTTR
jgi:hypothetical protein